jgi:hypothetical protein
MNLKFYIFSLLTLVSLACERQQIQTSLDKQTGRIDIHRCFCTEEAIRYLIEVDLGDKTVKYNPVNLPVDFKDNSYQVEFTAEFLDDSSTVYTNAPNDALIPAFKVRNIKLLNIKKVNLPSDFIPGDTVITKFAVLYHDYADNMSIRLDSIINESRCPLGVVCIWEGNAEARFMMNYNGSVNYFSLNTFRGSRTDTVIDGLYIKMIWLNPSPVEGIEFNPSKYSAGLVILKK